MGYKIADRDGIMRRRRANAAIVTLFVIMILIAVVGSAVLWDRRHDRFIEDCQARLHLDADRCGVLWKLK